MLNTKQQQMDRVGACSARLSRRQHGRSLLLTLIEQTLRHASPAERDAVIACPCREVTGGGVSGVLKLAVQSQNRVTGGELTAPLQDAASHVNFERYIVGIFKRRAQVYRAGLLNAPSGNQAETASPDTASTDVLSNSYMEIVALEHAPAGRNPAWQLRMRRSRRLSGSPAEIQMMRSSDRVLVTVSMLACAQALGQTGQRLEQADRAHPKCIQPAIDSTTAANM